MYRLFCISLFIRFFVPTGCIYADDIGCECFRSSPEVGGRFFYVFKSDMKHQDIDVDDRYISQVFKGPYTVQIVAGNASEYPESGHGNAENSDQIDKYFVAADLAG